jgi:hypothetical protein
MNMTGCIPVELTASKMPDITTQTVRIRGIA